MPKIIILNVGTAHALGDRESSTHPITRSGWRHAWFADQGDILISPVSVDDDFLQYLGGVLGFEPATVTVLSRERIITDDLLLCDELHADLLQLIGRDPLPWQLLPCFWTPGVAELASRLGIGPRDGLNFAAQHGSDLLNRKTHFRQLAAGAGIPLPEGSVVRTSKELADAVERHLPRTGTVIVKQDDGAGGLGNLTLTTGEAAPLPGSRESRQVGEDIPALAAEVWEALADELSHGLVVESYHTSTHQFYLEYSIEEGGIPAFLDSGGIRVRRDDNPASTEFIWVGLDLPAPLPPALAARAMQDAQRLASLIGQIGYRGHLNIDAIATDDAGLVFNEVNARWGGGLVAHSICERLIGMGYADHYVASTVRDMPPTALSTVLEILDAQGLAFSRSSREGVVVLACDPLLINNMECLVVADTRERARQIEGQLRTALATVTWDSDAPEFAGSGA
ncbi:peptide ligase PGM1-related protein [Streptomyces xanthochromogenes]|uniref:preATP grasp domain-containing protein n=1 Tax=Streptomyces xanthochromogenes TaxID=67384 RepID=UPI00343D87EA